MNQFCNTLRYAAGYIPRALYARSCKSKLNHWKTSSLSGNWTFWMMVKMSMLNHMTGLSTQIRGGLCHINTCYLLFQATELRRHIQNHPAPNFLEVWSSLMHIEDVFLYWSITGSDWEEQESAALLPMVVNLWITIWTVVQKYKAEQKTSVQKSKGARKQLLSLSHTTKL